MAYIPVRPISSVEPPPYIAAKPGDRARNLKRGRQILYSARDALDRAGMPALHRIVDGAADAMGAIGSRLVNGSIGLADWFLSSLDQIVVRHFAGLLALEARPGPDALDVLEPLIDRQAGFLSRFRQQIVAGGVKSAAVLIDRARRYGGAVWAGAMNTFKAIMGEREIRGMRVLDDGAEHCSVCPGLASKTWEPVEDLAPIGDSPCGSRCRCFYIFE